MKNVGIDKPFELESIYLDYAKHTLPGFPWNDLPPADSDTGGGTHHPAWHILFDPDTEQGCWWNFSLPRNFLKQHAVKVKIYWSTQLDGVAVVGDVVWGVKLLGRKEGEVWDAVLGAEVEGIGTVQDAVGELTVTEIPIPPATHLLEEKDTVVLQLARKAADGDDNMVEDAAVVMVDFEFARDANILVA